MEVCDSMTPIRSQRIKYPVFVRYRISYDNNIIEVCSFISPMHKVSKLRCSSLQVVFVS